MVAPLRVRLLLAVVACVLLHAEPAGAGDRITDLGRRLSTARDFRVRTQAALALGASRDKRAVAPLCRGLRDANASVRAAVAAALGKLRRGGKECLTRRLGRETSDFVKRVIRKTLARWDKSQTHQPVITDSTRLYVAVEVVDRTGRSDGRATTALVRRGMGRAAGSLSGVVLAPAQTRAQEAKHVLAKHPKVRGFLLSAQVEKPKYSNQALTVRLQVAIFTFPEKSLKATLPIKLTMEGATPENHGTEDKLIVTAGEHMLKRFAAQAERIP